MVENFLYRKKEKDNQIQEAQKVPNKMNPNRPTPRYNKNGKVKEDSKSSKRKL